MSRENAWPLSQFAGGVSQADPIAFDAPWSLSDYAPGSEKAALAGPAYFHHQYGLNSVVDAIAPGLHFVEGNVNIWPGAAGSVNLEGVTIVTAGNIQMSGPNVSFTPWDPDGIVLFANSGGTPSCWSQVVNASTSSLSFSGVIYAPNGKVGFYTSTTTSIAGAVIANSTQITGNHLNMELP